MEGSYDECNEAASFYELARSTADNKKNSLSRANSTFLYLKTHLCFIFLLIC